MKSNLDVTIVKNDSCIPLSFLIPCQVNMIVINASPYVSSLFFIFAESDFNAACTENTTSIYMYSDMF